MVIHRDGTQLKERVGELFAFDGLGRAKVDRIEAGDVCAVVGIKSVDIGNTIACIDKPNRCPSSASTSPPCT
jgi:GTP-binding protein